MTNFSVMRRSLSLVFVLLLSFTVSCGGGQKKSAKAQYRKGSKSTRYYPKRKSGSLDDIIYDNLEHRQGSGVHYSSSLKTNKKFDIPYTHNKYVQKWINYFTGRGRRHFNRYLARLGRFMPYIHSVTDRYGVPRDLVYLSMIESGFNMRARSWASAVGPWQFIKSTGAMYGLNVDYYVDERRSVEKSTHAAARHLRDLYQQFGDWYLAFAAYNAGPGKVRGAIRRDGSDYWDMVRGRYLRQETKDYVPKIIAAATIAKNPAKYGFRNIRYQRPVAFEVVTLKGPTDLEVAAECSGVDPDLIRLLNPELLRDMTPPHIPNYRLKIPRGTKSRFKKRYARLRPSQRVKIHYYTTDRGDTVKSVARQYGVSAKNLAKANPGKIGKTSKRYSKKVKVRYRSRGKRRYRWKKKRYTATSYSVRSGVRLTIPKARSMAGYKSSRDDAAAYRAQSKYGMRVASTSPVDTKKSRKAKKQQEKKQRQLAKAKAKQSKKRNPAPLSTAKTRSATPERQYSDLALEDERGVSGPTTFGSTPAGAGAGEPSDQQMRAAVAKLPVKSDLPDVASDPQSQKAWSTKKPVPVAKKTIKHKYHVVRRGETLKVIARRYGVKMSQLRDWNGKKVYPVLLSGAKIKVAGGSKLASAPSKKQSKPNYYTVRSGDTLGGIAKRHRVKSSQLIAWNGRKVSPVLQKGAKIRVTPGGSAPKAAKRRSYTVRSGDTLSSIARRNKVTVKQLKAWNGAKVSPVLKVGTKISLRGGKAGTSRNKVVKYKVKPGDSLHKIAKKHRTTPAKIQKLNGLKTSVIKPGAILVVRRK